MVSQHTLPNFRQQQGMVLIIGLVMLLLMTIVALAAIRGSGTQELMAGNMRDRNMAFQAAEAGLRVAEELLDDPSLLAFNNTNGLYLDLGASNDELPSEWSESDWQANSAAVGLNLEGVASPPRYVIEQLTRLPAAGTEGGAIDFSSQLGAQENIYYRITSRGTGGSNNAVVLLQTIVR
ncbi:hypothetical protein TDB9533_01726 [Thalassocella blandensis]|nr:hypothetical protein TDB9533_01726 [Thalassocella blandensis]